MKTKAVEPQPVESVPDPTVKPIADWTPDEIQAYSLAQGTTEHEVTVGVQAWLVGDLLTDLLPAINGVHGGCDVCRNHFAERANAVLEADGVPYRYSEKLDARGKPVRGPDGQMLNLVIVAA
jgi:hypothetical protein